MVKRWLYDSRSIEEIRAQVWFFCDGMVVVVVDSGCVCYGVGWRRGCGWE